MIDNVPAVLIVDDDDLQRENLKGLLFEQAPHWVVETSADEEEAIRLIKESFESGRPFSAVITDLVMANDPDSGSRLIRAAQKIDPLVMTIVYTGWPKAIEGMDTSGWGAFDVIVKSTGSVFGEAGRKIVAKATAAIHYREWAVRLDFLRRYFDPTVFATVGSDKSLLQPTTRWVTTAFWDIRGFSALCVKLLESPELVASFLRQYCELAGRIIFNNHGILDKFIGDGVMALFGVTDQSPKGRTEAALCAARAAIQLQREFGDLIDEWMPKWRSETGQEIDVLLGCGIHTGRAIVGNLGTKFRDQFTALGANINFAQRIESEAAQSPGSEILLSQTTAEYVRKDIPIRHQRDLTDVKNMPGKYPVFSIDIPKYIEVYGSIRTASRHFTHTSS